MKEELDNKIEEIRRRPAPACPENIEINVLRKIRIEKSTEPEDNVVGWLTGLIPNTNFSLTALALVVAVSTVATAASTLAMASDRKTELNRALGFDTITMTNVVNLQRH
jgi:hypothetical protein